MASKPQTIHVEARLWFDEVNGNTYHSARVTVDDALVLLVPFQYGYGEQYMYSALEVLGEHGIIDRDIYPNGSEKPLWQHARDEGFTLTSNHEHVTKAECEAWGSLDQGERSERQNQQKGRTMVELRKTYERLELVAYNELPESVRDSGDFDYVRDNEDRFFPRFVGIPRTPEGGEAWTYWLDTGDMMPARAEWQALGWHRLAVDTFFSAFAVKFLDGDDDGFVTVGEYF